MRLPALIACATAGLAAADGTRPPNIVVILIDDLGYADTGPLGATAHPTPNLDRMAREGRVFTDFYVAQAVCTASRAALLTGCYSNRVGLTGALGPRSRIGINPDETTLAEIAKQQGYATACFGKWHLGDDVRFLPTRHGFDRYFGLPYSNDMWPHHPTNGKAYPPLPLIDGETAVNPALTAQDQEQLTAQYTGKAVSFIAEHKDRPFLLYVPHSMVHVPLHVSERFRGKSGAGLFGDVMMEVDWSVGEILGALRTHRLERDTLVLFTSDNGPWLSYGDHAGSAKPFREGKGTMFEGGCRVGCIAWQPGRIPAGTVCREPAMTIDVLPTVAHLIGAEPPTRPIDGKDITPLLTGEPGAVPPHEALYFYYDRWLHAVRWKQWKLHLPHGYRTLDGKPGGTAGRPAPYVQKRLELSLYDLTTDPGETTDVKEAHPDVVATIQALAEHMRDDLGDEAVKRPARGAREPGRIP